MSQINSSSNNNLPENGQGSGVVNTPPQNRFFISLGKVFSAAEEGLAFIGSGTVIVFMMFYIVIDVISRSVFNNPFMNTQDLVGLCVVAATYGAISVVQKEGRHIRMDSITGKLSGKRSGHILEIFVLVIMLGMSGIIFYSTGRYDFIEGIQQGYVTNTVLYPMWPASFFLAAGYLLICFRLIVDIVKQIKAIKQGVFKTAEIRAPSEDD